MYIALLYSTFKSEKNRIPQLWVFYKLIDSFEKDEIVFIVDSEDYFCDPANLSPEFYHGVREDSQKIYSYKIPSLARLSQYKRIIFDPCSCEESNRFKSETEYRIYTGSNLSVGLFENLNSAYELMKKKGISPSAFLYHGDIPSVRTFCAKNNLPFISTELGPFRNWTYTNNSLFSVGGIYNAELIKVRYKNFLDGIVSSAVPFYEKKEILSIFLEEGYEDDLNDRLPAYDLGVAFTYSLLNRDQFNELLNTAQTFKGSVLGRFHPTDYNNAEIKKLTIDNSDKSLDFIKKCKRIVSSGSNITIEALLFDKVVFDIGISQYSWLAHKTVSNTLEPSCDLKMINFCIFALLIPFELCYNGDYINWRLSNPSEIDIYLRNLNYWKKIRGKAFDKRINRVQEDLSGSLEEIIIKQLTRQNTFKSSELAKQSTELNNKNGHIELLLEAERRLKNELSGKDKILEIKSIELNNKTGHIEKLMISENLLINQIDKKEKQLEIYQVELRNKTDHIEQLIAIEQKLNRKLFEQDNEDKFKTKEINRLEIALENLTVEINNKAGHIELLQGSERKLQNELANQSIELNNKNGHIELLLESERTLQNELAKQGIELNNKTDHIELLLESERRLINHTNQLTGDLNSILTSKSWKLASKVSLLSRKMFPYHSKRRLLAKLLYRLFSDPIKFITNSDFRKALNPDKIVFKSVDKPDVSIIIPVYNQFTFTYNCLKSILNNSGDKVNYEIIIADDCSTDLTKRMKKIVQNIKIVRPKKNLGFLRNCNNTAKTTKGKYILFLNNDTEVQENWLFPLIDLIEKDDTIGAVGSKLVYPSRILQEAGGIIWNDASAWNYGNMKDPSLPEFNYVKEVDYISGASLMIKKAIWDQLGGFDEKFVPAYYEDTDICFSIRKLGYKVMYQPASVVIHLEGVTNGKDISTGQKQYQVINQKKFFEKWNNILTKEHFPNGENVFLARDRSRKKKTILFIDHYVPHFDKDAGSRCVYMYLSLFSQIGFKVSFLGENTTPYQPYTSILQQMGIEVLYGNNFSTNWIEWLKENGKYFNYIFTCRSHISINYIDALKLYTNAKIIYWNADMQHVRLKRQYKITRDPNVLVLANTIEKMEMEMSKKADILYVVGTYEEKILNNLFPKKPVRNIPVYFYKTNEETYPTPQERKDLLFVGGFSHHPNEDAVQWFYENAFPQIVKEYPDIIWYIAGSNPTEKILAMQNENIVVTGFIEDEQLKSYYKNCRICIAPLRFGAGVKGKLIEAAYYRIPVVTTDIGVEGLSLEEEAFIIKPLDATFSKGIIELYNDFEKLKQISENCFNFIENHFSQRRALEILKKDILI